MKVRVPEENGEGIQHVIVSWEEEEGGGPVVGRAVSRTCGGAAEG